MIAKINKMKEMQRELDFSIYTAKGCSFDIERTFLALFDELGELTHELKASWCWWKDTVGEVDKAKVLEELVDVWHFALSIANNHNTYNAYYDHRDMLAVIDSQEKMSMSNAFREVVLCARVKPITVLTQLTLALGFTIEDVYVGYIEKNMVNFDRLNGGY